MSKTVQFTVSRADVDLLLTELGKQQSDVLDAPVLEALLATVVRLDTQASRLDTTHAQTADLHLAAEHADAFREWLARAATRESSAGHRANAEVFAGVRDSAR
jgi:hypothetical protein